MILKRIERQKLMIRSHNKRESVLFLALTKIIAEDVNEGKLELWVTVESFN